MAMMLRQARSCSVFQRFLHGSRRPFSSEQPNFVPYLGRVPTIEEARQLPKAMCELSADTLYVLAEQGHHDACTERLVRDVMRTDNIEWKEAALKVKEIRAENRKNNWMAHGPAQAGLLIGSVSAIGSIPMVFSFPVAKWFNQHFVTSELPDPADTETLCEVGMWTWGWNEPMLGTASFVILCAQFVRNQMLNMDMKPYTHWVRHRKAKELCALYPQYDEDILTDFSLTARLTPMYLRKSS